MAIHFHLSSSPFSSPSLPPSLSHQIEAIVAGEVAMEESSELPSDPVELQTVIEEAESQLATLQEKMAEEASKLERYKVCCLLPPVHYIQRSHL